MELTKERLAQILRAIDSEAYDEAEIMGWFNSDDIMEMARQLLTGMEQEPVAWMHRNGVSLMWAGDLDAKFKVKQGGWSPLYAAPQLSSTPPEQTLRSAWLSAVPDAIEIDDDFDSAFEHGKAVGWNAYRADMLQGAEPVEKECRLPEDFNFDRFNDLVWLEAVASNPHMHSPTTSTIAMVALELNRKLAEPYQNMDTKRMDWLVKHVVEVREPMIYGSHHLFYAKELSDVTEEYRNDLREKIDKAMNDDK